RRGPSPCYSPWEPPWVLLAVQLNNNQARLRFHLPHSAALRPDFEKALPTGCTGEEACQKVGLDICRGPMADGTDGAWSESEGRILLNQMVDWPPRIEFTIFHEIV